MNKTETDLKRNPSGSGWMATSTYLALNGLDWELTTSKSVNGYLITVAQGGKITEKEGYSNFEFVMFDDPRYTVDTVSNRATEKNILELHKANCTLFESQMRGLNHTYTKA